MKIDVSRENGVCFLCLSYKVRLLETFVRGVSAELWRPYFRSDPENWWLEMSVSGCKLIAD